MRQLDSASLKSKLTLDFIINKFIGYRLLKVMPKLSKCITSDELFLKIYYRLAMSKWLDLDNPKTYTEKLQKLKLLNKGQDFSDKVDKLKVREIVKEKIGEDYLIPIIGSWNAFDEIDFSSLPNQFVLKTTHDSGTVIICTDKLTLDRDTAKLKLTNALQRNYFYLSREYPYRYATPKIICEKYMFDENQMELDDYKFFCFHGQPNFVEITTGKGQYKQRGYYNLDLEPMPFTLGNSVNLPLLEEVACFEKMCALARVLAEGLIHVRVDLYVVNSKVYFGEYTFHHSGGVFDVQPTTWDLEIGKMISL